MTDFDGPMLPLNAFVEDALLCGTDFYSDKSLEPSKIEEAFRMYQRAREGTNLGIAISGRIQIGDEEAEERMDPSLRIPSDEVYPAIDKAMQENFELMNHDYSRRRNGSIFHYPYREWTFLINDAWLLGSIHTKTEMHTASPLRWENFWVAHEARPSTMARELIGLSVSGYKFSKPSTKLEMIARCMDAEKASNVTLTALKNEVSKYQSEETLREFFDKLPNNIKDDELSEEHSAEIMARVMPIVDLKKQRTGRA